jgi:transposase
MRYELADYEWIAIKPFLPNKPRGVSRVNDRRVLNGIFWALRSGASWRDPPDNFGPYTTCYNRFVRWRRTGVWDRIMNSLSLAHDAGVQMIDKSIVRVHQHGAFITRNRRQSMGQSRGGLTSKIMRSSIPMGFERFFNRIKHCRRVATRYDKLAASHLAFVNDSTSLNSLLLNLVIAICSVKHLACCRR